jgi:hypothetical protein
MTDTNKDGKVTYSEFENLVIMTLQKCGIEIFE